MLTAQGHPPYVEILILRCVIRTNTSSLCAAGIHVCQIPRFRRRSALETNSYSSFSWGWAMPNKSRSKTIRTNAIVIGGLAVSALLLASATSAKDENGQLGTPSAPGAATAHARQAAIRQPLPPNTGPLKSYLRASYGTGGVALRNRITGAIHISGVHRPDAGRLALLGRALSDNADDDAGNPTQTALSRNGLRKPEGGR